VSGVEPNPGSNNPHLPIPTSNIFLSFPKFSYFDTENHYNTNGGVTIIKLIIN